MFLYTFWGQISVMVATIFMFLAQMKVQTSYRKYSTVMSSIGMTGSQVAARLLSSNGISDVTIERISGELSDHYDPIKKVLRLSNGVYNNTSIAAISIAAHEVGHAVQHNTGYVQLKLRSAIVPIANLGSLAAMPVFFFGILIGSNTIMNVGIIFFTFTFLFQVVTLPVEFNASRRALKMLDNNGLLEKKELGSAKQVLTAAALTYVAGMLLQLANLFSLILARDRNNNRRK